MSANTPYDYEQDSHLDSMSLGRTRNLLGLSRQDFNAYSREYIDDGQRALSPLSVLNIAQAAYHAGASKNFFPTLKNVGQEIVAHVRQYAPDLEAGVQVQVNEFVAGADEAPADQLAIDASITPPHLTSTLERTYSSISIGL